VGSAPVRNRFRRRIRALFTELTPQLAPGTYLVAAAPAVSDLDHGELRRTLTRNLDRLGATS
jgi:ribonuclease P protein component